MDVEDATMFPFYPIPPVGRGLIRDFGKQPAGQFSVSRVAQSVASRVPPKLVGRRCRIMCHPEQAKRVEPLAKRRGGCRVSGRRDLSWSYSIPSLDPIFAVPARYPFGVRLRYRCAQDDTVDGAVVGQRGNDGVAMASSQGFVKTPLTAYGGALPKGEPFDMFPFCFVAMAC